MKKIVLFCRVSTDRQSYDEQLEDLVKFAKSRGINDDEMLIIEGAGASAIKLNEAYLDMINKVQEAIKQNPFVTQEELSQIVGIAKLNINKNMK